MDAFIVQPIPPQTPQTSTNSSKEQPSNEPAFAPTLSQAISDREESNSQSSNTHSPASEDQDKSILDPESKHHDAEYNGSESESPYALQSSTPIEYNQNQSLNLDISFITKASEQTPVLSPVEPAVKDHSSNIAQSLNVRPSEISFFTAESATKDHLSQAQSLNVQPTNISFSSAESAIKDQLHHLAQPSKIESPTPASIHLNKPDVQKSTDAVSIYKIQLSNSVLSSSPLNSQAALSQAPQEGNINTTPPLQESVAQQILNTALKIDSSAKVTSDLQVQPDTQNRTPVQFSSNALKTEQFDLLQKNDTLTWTQQKPEVPPTTKLVNIAQIATNNEEIVIEKTPSLLTEKIISHLTQIPAERSAPSLRRDTLALRQDITGQFIDSKIQRQDLVEDQLGGQLNSTMDDELKNGSQLNVTSKPGDTPSETNFSQSLSQLSVEKGNQSPGEIIKPGGTTLANQVFEDNILNQVIQKFRISKNLQDSRLAMKLHPAELGELKIDIQLKNGSVNASILAQSQQVQEILEKNMPRLKEMMEQQGLSIDEIAINLDSDVTEDQNFFEEHLTKDENSFTNRKNRNSQAAFTLDPLDEEKEADQNDTDTGVNVKV